MNDQPPTGDATMSAGAGRKWPAVPGYEIVAELGRGGMGVVYEARQLALDRLVALKLIRDGALANSQDQGRFRIEAEAAARMQHPNIVQLYEVGEHDGRLYYSMELADGRLDQQIGGRPQPPRFAAELVRTLALAMQHAHDRQIIHRDLKPANILVVGPVGPMNPMGPMSSYTPKIADFGLAKRLDTQSTAWTQEGAILGTASYMAPEQAAGRIRDLGPAVDIYALGAILYELLTGRPPFVGETWQQTLQRVIDADPTPPTRLQRDVPRDLETICLKCLDKDPERRYASAQALAEDLGRFLGAQPVAATPLSALDQLQRLAGRDGYEIVRVAGHGPRSTVYHALHGPARQPVALKVFDAGITEADWHARQRCASAQWATLAHPNLLPIQRSGWWDGLPYVVMEFVPTDSLAARIAGQPFALDQTLDIVAQLAETVSYLHRQGVIHGNLKPSNVFLAADGIPRIADFRPTGGLFITSQPTADNALNGLGYLPPEVCANLDAEPRFYTDIYGLGAIFYELLTGRPPFGGDESGAVSEQVRSQTPPLPMSLNVKVTPPIEAACLRCLHKNPWMRYARAYDLYLRLQHLRKQSTGRS